MRRELLCTTQVVISLEMRRELLCTTQLVISLEMRDAQFANHAVVIIHDWQGQEVGGMDVVRSYKMTQSQNNCVCATNYCFGCYLSSLTVCCLAAFWAYYFWGGWTHRTKEHEERKGWGGGGGQTPQSQRQRLAI